MKFSIITPTHKRKDSLVRAMSSVLSQTYKDWEMIIVNDSPTDESYSDFPSLIKDERVRYYVNDRNRGVNYSRNFGIDKVSADSKWIIFLDDDDYFAPDCLQSFWNIILVNKNAKWFLTNRALRNGSPLTKVKGGEGYYSYAKDYLLLRKIKGDATHCIETKLITLHKMRFSRSIKQGEEWFFFYQVGSRSKIYYQDHNSTISDGYDEGQGLNFRKRPISEKLETLVKLAYEGGEKHVLHQLPFLTYILIRILLTFLKRNR